MDIQMIREGIYRLPIPVPFPIKYIYCYLLRDKQGWSIIDAGIQYQEAITAWQSAFDELNVRPESVHSIYITHFHPDHFGLSGWLQDYTGAPVYMNPQEIQMANLVWSADSRQADDIGDMCREHGTPDELSRQITDHMKKLSKHVRMPTMIPLTEQVVNLGEQDWQVLISPGHSDGHTCFYQPESKLLLAGDHILNKITPNISSWPHCLPNPLKMYMDSLNRVKKLDIKVSLPSHNEVVEQTPHRITEIIEHHEKRLDQMYLLAAPGKTTYDVANLIFKHRELNAHQWRFAIAETLSHLIYLKEVGRLSVERENGICFFYGD